jgi:WD40 repeat protein
MNRDILCVLIVAQALAACRRQPEVEAAPVQGSTPAAPTVAQPPAAAKDVAAAGTTSRGGAIYRVGEPKLHLATGDVTSLQMSARGELAAVSDFDSTVSVWETRTGTLLRRLRNPELPNKYDRQNALLSPTGDWLAVPFNSPLYLFRRPFDAVPVKTPCYSGLAFSADEKMIICGNSVPYVLDILSNKMIANIPDDRFREHTMAVAFSSDQKSMFWSTVRKIYRWNFTGDGKIVDIYTSRVDMYPRAFLAHGDNAVVDQDNALLRIDLRTGIATPLPKVAGLWTAISPLGTKAASADDDKLRVMDLGTGKETIFPVKGRITKIAFSEDDNILTFVNDPAPTSTENAAVLQVLDLRTGLRAYPAPMRFARWAAGDVAVLAKDGAYSTLAMASQTRGTIDAAGVAALSPQPPSGAPAWATWVSEGPGGKRIVSEPRPRSAVIPERREKVDCELTMRLWTPGGSKPANAAAGRERTLVSSCAAKDLDPPQGDPGWYHGGGWIVGLSRGKANLYDDHGKAVATLDVGFPKYPKKDFRHEYWNLALSPTGKHMAILWRRADYGGDLPQKYNPREDAVHIAESEANIDCVSRDVVKGCAQEYFLEIWSLGPKPKRIWKERLTLPRPSWKLEPKIASGPITFDSEGKRVLVGFRDGDILIRALTDKDADINGKRETKPLEHIHQVAVTKLSVSPDSRWVFSEDLTGEQRIWALPPP